MSDDAFETDSELKEIPEGFSAVVTDAPDTEEEETEETLPEEPDTDTEEEEDEPDDYQAIAQYMNDVLYEDN